MSKIKIGAQVTAKVRHTNVTVSGTFQGYELEDQEDPTSVCGKVFYVKDGMQHLDYVYVDSIKVCKGEDEDERIRKILIHIVKGACDKYGIKYIGDEIGQEKLLAYLEKQKELAVIPDELVKNYKLFCGQGGRELALLINAINGFNKQKEQKPVHTAKEMWKEMRLEVYAQASGNRHEPNYSDDSTKMFSLCDIDEIFEKIGDSTVGSQPAEWSEEDERTLESFLGWLQGSMGEKTYSSWLKSLPERFSLKPKQEWSEEDKHCIHQLILFCENCMQQDSEAIRCATWLKSLRPQPKQEWSEEDENIYNKALDAIYYKDCNEKDDVISALNDLCDLISRKRKVIPPYAHWKPSKEQMEALNAVANEGVLLDLFNDLLKLL